VVFKDSSLDSLKSTVKIVEFFSETKAIAPEVNFVLPIRYFVRSTGEGISTLKVLI